MRLQISSPSSVVNNDRRPIGRFPGVMGLDQFDRGAHLATYYARRLCGARVRLRSRSKQGLQPRALARVRPGRNGHDYTRRMRLPRIPVQNFQGFGRPNFPGKIYPQRVRGSYIRASWTRSGWPGELARGQRAHRRSKGVGVDRVAGLARRAGGGRPSRARRAARPGPGRAGTVSLVEGASGKDRSA
jgi:hypothetical protein